MAEAFLALAAFVWIAAGLITWAASVTVMHQILACLLISFGVIFGGLVTIIDIMKAERKKGAAPVATTPPPIPHRADAYLGGL